jgi:hypothetical protein
MNNKKRRRRMSKRLLLFCLFLSGIVSQLCAQSFDKLYVYAANGKEQSFDLNRLKMTFASRQFDVSPWNSSATAMLYDNVAAITFVRREKDDVAANDAGINIYFNPDQCIIVLESETGIEVVKVFNIQGLLLYDIKPRSTLVNLSLSASPAGVYIIQANGKETGSTKKIIKQQK